MLQQRVSLTQELKETTMRLNAELKAFIQATNMIPPDELYRCLAKTLCELEPEFKKSNTAELWVDLTKLDMNTVRTLRDYLKAELEKHGYHYPT